MNASVGMVWASLEESEAVLMLDPSRAPHTVFVSPFPFPSSSVLWKTYYFNVHNNPEAWQDEVGLLQSQTLGRTSDAGF